jgi:putative membrane protein
MSRTIGTRLWTLVFFAVFIWSAIHPHDRLTWVLEVSPALIGIMLMAITYQRFPLTTLLYVLILLHCVVLMIGGHYTYAEVPFFDGLLGAERNNYDKLGHFFQGFVPAILAREILIRLSVASTAAWRNVFIVSLCLAFSAFYELIEWWVALLSDEAAESFLGTQGYVWDTQSDMGFALTGAILALLLLSKFHDSQLKRFL